MLTFISHVIAVSTKHQHFFSQNSFRQNSIINKNTKTHVNYHKPWLQEKQENILQKDVKSVKKENITKRCTFGYKRKCDKNDVH